jgi:amino acid adenylation domain-containing protein
VDAVQSRAKVTRLLGKCQARAILTQSCYGFRAGPSGPLPLLAVDRQRPAGAPITATAGSPADLAYVMFTPGSTGEPKGVMIEHRSVVNSVRAISQQIQLSPADRVFGISPMSFDLSVWDIFGTLAAGAALVMPDPAPSLQPDPATWAATAAAGGVTVCNSAPMLADRFAEAVTDQPGLPRPPVRAFIMGGDWIPLTLPGRLRQLWPGSKVIAVGGATEASIWSSAFEVRGVDAAWPSIPYGTPLAGQTMRVLDHNLDIRPPWAAGRIYIGGAGLARGYLGDAERTAERFITHPVTGERLYCTGDLGRYRPDGTIELLGCEDRQLRLQGRRIAPGEIETAVRDCPGVRDCIVTMVTEPADQQCLVALVVPEAGGRPESQAIIAQLRARLPEYMIPARTHVTGRLPLTPNGKIDIPAAVARLPR